MDKVCKEVVIAHCGLICSACGAYLKSKCRGCNSDKPMFRKCPVKKCNLEKGYRTCGDCTEFDDVRRCKKLNNFISKIFGFVFRSDRIAKVERIREVGYDQYSNENS